MHLFKNLGWTWNCILTDCWSGYIQGNKAIHIQRWLHVCLYGPGMFLFKVVIKECFLVNSLKFQSIHLQGISALLLTSSVMPIGYYLFTFEFQLWFLLQCWVTSACFIRSLYMDQSLIIASYSACKTSVHSLDIGAVWHKAVSCLY